MNLTRIQRFILTIRNKDVWWPIMFGVVWMFVVLCATYVIVMRTPLGQIDTQWHNLYMYVWANWDGGHYIDIASKGYDIVQYAFFPLFPFLIIVTHQIIGEGHSYILAGLIVSRTSLLIALVYLYKLFRLDHDESKSQMSLFLLLSFPTGMFLMAVYTEPLFLATSAASLYYARKRNWALAGGAAFLAALTRTVGIALLFPLIYEFLKDIPARSVTEQIGKAIRDWRFIFCFFSLIGVLVYATYSYGQTGNFLQMLESQKYWTEIANRGGEGIRSPIRAFRVGYEAIETFEVSPQYIIPFLDLVPMLIFFALTFASMVFKSIKIPFSYNIFSLGVLFIPLLQGSTQSIFRYILVAFPVFIILMKIGERSKVFLYCWLALCLMLYGNMLNTFIFGWWVS